MTRHLAKLTLARRYLAAAKYDEAAMLLLALATENADDAGLLNEVGYLLTRAGWLQKALVVLYKALAVAETPEVLCNLGNALRQSGDRAEAERHLRRAVDLDPGLAAGWHDLGLTLLDQDETQAEACLRRAVALAPDERAILRDLAVLTLRKGNAGEALVMLLRAGAEASDDPDMRSALASVLAALDRPKAARREVEVAVQMAPDRGDLLVSLAAACLDDNDLHGALQACHHALALDPEDADAHWARGHALLQRGDYAGGFADYEWRWRTRDFRHRIKPWPGQPWAGQPVQGRTVLVAAEQGYGDMIQFARYLTPLAERGARVLVEAWPPLTRLLAGVAGVAATVPPGQLPGEAVDFHVPFLSLPHRLDLATPLAQAIPYVRVPGTPDPVPPSLPGKPLKVGVCWWAKANPRRRALPLSLLLEMAASRPVTLYGLQIDGPERLADAMPAIDLSARLTDFTHTAEAIAQFDLVITVDTAVAHLAGAMGRPVWVMLRNAPDWRWSQGDATPWYPTARLFRQSEPGQWDGLVSALGVALDQFCAERV